jgi:hypothetical protein
MDERFARMDERFDEMRRQSDERFARMDERFDEMRRQSDERFARIDERFARVDERLENIENRFTSFRRELTADTRRIVDNALSKFGGRAGVKSEASFRKLLRYFLGLGLDSPHVEQKVLRKYNAAGDLIDEGEIDIVVRNGRVFLVEYKYYIHEGDVYNFLHNVALYNDLVGPHEEAVIACAETDERGMALRIAAWNHVRVLAGEDPDDEE